MNVAEFTMWTQDNDAADRKKECITGIFIKTLDFKFHSTLAQETIRKPLSSIQKEPLANSTIKAEGTENMDPKHKVSKKQKEFCITLLHFWRVFCITNICLPRGDFLILCFR